MALNIEVSPANVGAVNVKASYGSAGPISSRGTFDAVPYSQVIFRAKVTNSKYVFSYWNIEDATTGEITTSSELPLVITVDGSKTITAVFESAQIRLYYGVSNGTFVTPDPRRQYITVNRGDTVTLKVQPDKLNARCFWPGVDPDNARVILANDAQRITYSNTITMTGPFRHSDIYGDYKKIDVVFYEPNVITLGPGDNIQNAVDRAGDLDIIYLKADTYPLESSITITRNIEISGVSPEDDSAGGTILDGSIGGRAFYFAGAGVTQRTVLQGLTLQNFDIVATNGRSGSHSDIDPFYYHADSGGSAYGGAIYCYQASPLIRKVNFINCHVEGGDGGAGANGNDTQLNGGNGGWPGAAGGGAIALIDSDANLVECTFSACYALGGNGGDGGQASGAAGQAGQSGGWIESPLFGNLFDNDTVDYLAAFGGVGGAAYCDANSEATFNQCSFTGCYVDSGVIGLGGYTFNGVQTAPFNTWELDAAGGAVYVGGQGASVSYTQNISLSYAGNPTSQAQFTDCNFIDNTAYQPSTGLAYDNLNSFGGALAVAYNLQPILTDCEFTGNTATAGGAIFSNGSGMTLKHCTASENLAYYGGAGYFDGGDPHVVGGRYYANTASVGSVNVDANDGSEISGDGGGFFLTSCDANFLDAHIYQNLANRSGGGLYLEGESTQAIHNCLFTQNTAGRDGAAISTNLVAEPFISSSTLSGNIVTGYQSEDNGYGGGLYVGYASHAHVIDSIIWGNTAAAASTLEYGDQIAIDYGLRGSGVLEISYSDVGPEASDDNNTGDDSYAFYEYSSLNLSSRQYVGSQLGLSSGEPQALYGVDGFVGSDGVDRIIGYSIGVPEDPCDPNAVAYIYTVEVPTGSDADALPAAERTFTLVQKFYLDVNAYDIGTNCEFYVDANEDVIYFGASQFGIRRYTADGSVRNLAATGPSTSYSFDVNEANDFTEYEGVTQSLAYDPAEDRWYTLAVDPNASDIVQVWVYDGSQGNTGVWERAFSYSGEAGYIEFVDGYLMMIEPSNPALRYYTPEGILVQRDIGQANASRYLALGHGAFGHYWVSDSSGTVRELGMNEDYIASYGEPIYVAEGATLVGWDEFDGFDVGLHNINLDPCFVDAYYYLTQDPIDPNATSPCVDAGSADVNDPNVALGYSYTTSYNGDLDLGIVDMGYHYSLDPDYGLMVQLTLEVVDENGNVIEDENAIKGTVAGTDQYYPTGTVVSLTAISDPNYRLVMWSGTNNDASDSQSNTVTMDQDRTIQVRFGDDIYNLTTSVIGGHGSIVNASGPVPSGDLTLVAIPDDGYRVREWTGTDNDPAWNQNEVTVLMDGDRTVTVEFEKDQIVVLNVPDNYATIQEAINAAGAGSTQIVLRRNENAYTVPADGDGIDFAGKQIILSSTNPNDPEVVANTVINCGGGEYSPSRAFWFHSGEDNRTQILGITIVNGFQRGPIGKHGTTPSLPNTPNPLERKDPEDENSAYRNQMGDYAVGNGYGGAVLCEEGSSPLFVNCVFKNCTVAGARGGDGAAGQFGVWSFLDADGNVQTTPDGQWGGHGGAAYGNGYGGVVACRDGSAPLFKSCSFIDNTAQGAIGGTGGRGGDAEEPLPDVFNGLESAGGNAGDAEGSGLGGAIYCDGGSAPTFKQCTFSGNVALNAIGGDGGEMGDGNPDEDLYPSAGMPGAGYTGGEVVGGAISVDDDSSVNLIDCTFTEIRPGNVWPPVPSLRTPRGPRTRNSITTTPRVVPCIWRRPLMPIS